MSKKQLLSDISEGETVKVLAIDASHDLRHRLLSFGIRKGSKITVETHSLRSSTLKIVVGSTKLALRSLEAQSISVETMSVKQTIVIATGNQGKLKEFYTILGSERFEFKSLSDIGFHDEIIEDGDTFEANAIIKAHAVRAFCDLPVMADDSGIEVDALGGKPGIYTARFAGENATDLENNEKLLHELSENSNRGAQFVCALCFIDALGNETVVRGEVKGSILESPVGDRGFGYDPLFVPVGTTMSFGQMSMEDKKALSHRGEAIKKLKKASFE